MKRTLCALILAVLILPACNATQLGQLQAASDRADAQLADARQQLADAKAEAATQPDSEAVVEKIEKLETVVDKLKPVAERLKDELAKADATDETAGFAAITAAVAPLLGPYGILASAVVGIGLSTYKAVKNGKIAKARLEAAEEIAGSIEAAKAAGGGVIDFKKPETAAILNAGQGDTAKAIVDSVQ